MARPLAGRHVVTTRDARSRLDTLLAAAGADVVHVPLIEIVEPVDGGAELEVALSDLEAFEWVVVTSRHGAERVGAALRGRPIRLAAVGARTADVLERLADRPVDIVPGRQIGSELVAALPDRAGRVLIAQADRADDSVSTGLRQRGYDVRCVTAYRTVSRHPSRRELRAARGADAVTFASGSAAVAWAETIGVELPPVVAAIGPSTAAAAASAGLAMTHVAADHDVDGLAAVVVTAFDSEHVHSVPATS